MPCTTRPVRTPAADAPRTNTLRTLPACGDDDSASGRGSAPSAGGSWSCGRGTAEGCEGRSGCGAPTPCCDGFSSATSAILPENGPPYDRYRPSDPAVAGRAAPGHVAPGCAPVPTDG
ncbi:hypothetical protein GCM10025734_48770 [Kitasatospora paranensis]